METEADLLIGKFILNFNNKQNKFFPTNPPLKQLVLLLQVT